MKRKYSFIFLLTIVSFILLFSVSAAAENSIQTEGFTIEDEVFLNALAMYDADENGIITLEELENITYLNLDGLAIKTLKGIENLNIKCIYARDCQLESLDGIRDISELEALYLDNNNISSLGDISKLKLKRFEIRSNNLSDISDFIKIINTGATEIFVSGNPFYEEAREYYFMNVDTKLSIIGVPGGYAYQKYNAGEMSVDIAEFISKSNDLNLSDLEFEIEDTSIATIGEKMFFLRESNYDSEINLYPAGYPLHVLGYIDNIQLIDLLKPGKTRMKITCGDYVKYTDIWVLEDFSGKILIELAELSDIGFANILKNLKTTKTGYITYETLASITDITINGEDSRIVDYGTLSHMKKLKNLYLENYDQKLLDEAINLNLGEDVEKIDISNSEISNLEFDGKFDSVKRIIVDGNMIEKVDIADSFPNVYSVNLKNNNINDVDDIKIPNSVRYLYLEGNQLQEDAEEQLFERYMYTNDIEGIKGETYSAMLIDIIPTDQISIKIEDNNIAKAVGNEITFINSGTTTMKVSYKSIEKTISITVRNDELRKIGDVNGDGSVNAADALLVLKHAAKIETLADEILLSADVTEDERVDAEDALAILRIAAKIE